MSLAYPVTEAAFLIKRVIFLFQTKANFILRFAADGAKIVFYKGAAQPSEAEEKEKDSSAGLPHEHAKNYLLARGAISPDKKFAVIYPTLDAEEAAEDANHPERIKDYLVAL